MGKSYYEKGIIKKILSLIQHFDYDYYFCIKNKVQDPNYKNYLFKFYWLYKIKKMDAFNNASLGTNINSGAYFKSPPILPHGLNGIIIGHDVQIGENVTIHQQVTIAHGSKITIGNNVFIGAGAKILAGSHIGNNVRIGANCVVFESVPDNSTVVLPKPRIIKREE